MAHEATLIAQLRALEQLTRTEAQIARIRVAQARTDAVRRELRQNAANADRRSAEILERLRAVGGVPDVVTPAIGRLLAFVKGTVEQGQRLDEALLGDLTLEHQLLDRARYLKVLAQTAGRSDVESLAERLITAHSATVDWLTTVLAELALGGPPALSPTPLQVIAGGVTRVAALPTRFAVEGVNTVLHRVRRTGEDVRDAAVHYAGQAARFGSETREVAAAGRDAALRRAEGVARREGAGETAQRVHEARRDLGALRAEELPVKNYETLTAQQAIAAIRELTEPDDLTAMIAYEEANKNRAGVVSAAQTRHAALAKEAAGVS
ncbi:MAG TPA: ferritin-like domain-containing protein [Pseudonocardia sp.]|nr:ferritin-like domain-containing protein [Pseudonocardia sp.]